MTLIPIPRPSPPFRAAARTGCLAALAVFAAAAAAGAAADQTSAPPESVSAVIHADFPYEMKAGSLAMEGPNAGVQSFQKTGPLSTPALAWKDLSPPAAKTGTPQPVVSLPRFTVTAQKLPPLWNRLDQIDESIVHEESFTVPNRADLFLNSDRASNFLQKFLVSFGRETAQKRARDASKRIEVLEMQRIVEIGLHSSSSADRQRLQDDRAALKELGAQKLDQSSFSDPRTGN